MNQNVFQLTVEQSAELEAHPIGTIKTDIGGTQQFEIRVRIAKKMCQKFLDLEPDMPAQVRQMYEKYPLWKFYCDVGGVTSRPRRMYGVADAEKSTLHMISASMLMISHRIDGVHTSEIMAVDDWTDDQKMIILTTDSPDLFFDPLGFKLVIQAFH